MQLVPFWKQLGEGFPSPFSIKGESHDPTD
nr:MAG TPA: hypothetical protein [Caudoviricetes sp.]